VINWLRASSGADGIALGGDGGRTATMAVVSADNKSITLSVLAGVRSCALALSGALSRNATGILELWVSLHTLLYWSHVASRIT
jgi:hypothetical protein